MGEELPIQIFSVLLSMVIVVFGIGMFWCFRLFLQDRRQRRSDGVPEWNGAAFDSKAVAERVRQLRKDYVDTLVEKPDDRCQRRERVARARGVVGSRAYFQHIRPDAPETVAEISTS